MFKTWEWTTFALLSGLADSVEKFSSFWIVFSASQNLSTGLLAWFHKKLLSFSNTVSVSNVRVLYIWTKPVCTLPQTVANIHIRQARCSLDFPKILKNTSTHLLKLNPDRILENNWKNDVMDELLLFSRNNCAALAKLMLMLMLADHGQLWFCSN